MAALRGERVASKSRGLHITAQPPMQTVSHTRTLTIKVELNDYAALRMRGLPFSCRHEDIITFFNDFDAHIDSIKIGKNSDGTKTGEATILFKNEDECKRAF